MNDIITLLNTHFGGSKRIIKIDIAKLHNDLLSIINFNDHKPKYFAEFKNEFEDLFEKIYSINRDGYGIDFEILRLRVFLHLNRFKANNEELNEVFRSIRDLYNLQKELQKLTAKNMDLEKSNDTFSKIIIKLKKDLFSKDAQLKELSEERDIQKKENIRLEKELNRIDKDYRQRLSRLSDEVDITTKEMKKQMFLARQVPQLKKEKELKLANIERLKEEKKQLIVDYTAKITELNNDLEKLRKERISYNELITNLKSDKEKIEFQYTQITKHIEEAYERITKLNKNELENATKYFESQNLDRVETLFDQSLRFEEDGKYYKVAVYIQDGFIQKGTKTEDLHRYHIYNCQTIQDMRTKDKGFRYSISSRSDNFFKYRLYSDKNEIIIDTEEQELHICKNCLNIYNFNFSKLRRNKVLEPIKFNEAKLLNEYIHTEVFELEENKEVLLLPSDFVFDYEYIPNVYSEDWKVYSKLIKKMRNNTCEECSWRPTSAEEMKYLHTHHKNFRKFDDEPRNLKVLCIDCHSNQLDHKHLKKSLDWKDFRIIKTVFEKEKTFVQEV